MSGAFPWRWSGLPLLSKELAERARRKRTYILRVVFALMFYALFVLIHALIVLRGRGTIWTMGIGGQLFWILVNIEFACIYLTVPALLSGVVTMEKERDSLGLLLLTGLKPWQIVLQKLGAGIIPALTILLIATPFAAVCYTYGGLSRVGLGIASLLLVLAVLQISAIAIWCSCRFRTTVGAFFATYVTAAALVLGSAAAEWVISQTGFHFLRWWEKDIFSYIPPLVWEGFSDGAPMWRGICVSCAEMLLMIWLFLWLAIRALPKYAFAKPQHWMKTVSGKLDVLIHIFKGKAGEDFVRKGNVELIGNAPVYWHELKSRGLLHPENRGRILLVILIPVSGIAAVMLNFHKFDDLMAFLGIMGGLGVVLLSSSAASIFAVERVNQTHEVLMTTPMPARQILLEKATALRAVVWMIAIPMLVVFAAKFWGERSELIEIEREDALLPMQFLRAVCTALLLAVVLPAFGWLAIWCGLKCRTRMKAIGLAWVLIALWNVLPTFAMEVLDLGDAKDPWRHIRILSPIVVPAMHELRFSADPRVMHDRWLAVLTSVAFNCSVLAALRWHCLRNAEYFLRRA